MANEPKRPLPPSLLNTLPNAIDLFNLISRQQRLIAALTRELQQLSQDPIRLARAYVVMHRLREELDLVVSTYNKLYEQYAKELIPATFEQAGITSLPLAEGYRVGVSVRIWASIKKDQREAAHTWMRDNGFESLITETVNASALSAAVKTYGEEQNREFPSDLFTTAIVPNTSVTPTS